MSYRRPAGGVSRRRFGLAVTAWPVAFMAIPRLALAADPRETLQRVKASVVAVGTFQKTRTPPFAFGGTGFAVADGSVVATNAHVLPAQLNAERKEALVVAIPQKGHDAGNTLVRMAKVLLADRDRDVALLRIEGPRLPPLALGPAGAMSAREGDTLFFTGFPIGAALGLIPVTHRAMVSALTPLAFPLPDSSRLDARAVRRLSAPDSTVIQLDGTAYPGSSGSPLYDPESGVVIGVINAALVKGSRESSLTSPSGIAYAIPIQAYRDALSAYE